jgi:hypothetical protein
VPIEVDPRPRAVRERSGEPERTACRRSRAGEDRGVKSMLDVLMLVLGIGFFALSVAYALACDRL